MSGIGYDPDVDVLYVLLSDADIVRTRPIDDVRIIDYDATNAVIGVEFVNAMSGIDLAGVPSANEIERLLEESGLELPRSAA